MTRYWVISINMFVKIMSHERHGGLKSLQADNIQNIIPLFYLNVLTLIPAWISNHTPSKVWDGIIYPFLNFNRATVEV